MNKAKRILVLLIVLCLCGTAQAADMTKEEAYAENLGLLDLYLQADPAAGVNINVLCSNFQALGNYRCSMEFWLYASVLSALERDEYNEALRFYNVLTLYAEEGSSFTNLFADNSFTDAFPAIRPIAEMEQYIQARKEENAGNQTKAAEHYEKCLKFFDARSRYQLGRPDLDLIYAQILVQLKDGDYAAAMENARLLMSYGYEGAEDLYFVAEMQLAGAAATPAPQETVAPAASFTVTGSADKGKVTLRWEKVPGAAKYRIYHAVIKHGEKNFALVTETSKTVIALTQTEAGVNNYYYIEAIGNNESGTLLARSEETSIYVSRTSGTHLTIGNGNGSLSDEAKDWLSSTPTPKPGGGLTIGNGSDDGWTIGNGNGSLSDEAKDWLSSTPTPKPGGGLTIGQYEATPAPDRVADFTIGNGYESDWDFEMEDNNDDGGWTIGGSDIDWDFETEDNSDDVGWTIGGSDIDWDFETEDSNEDDDLSSKWSMTGTPASDSNTGITILDDSDDKWGF